MNVALTLKLLEYKNIMHQYKTQNNTIKKSIYVSKLNNIRSSIINNITTKDLSFEKLFYILKKYERRTSYRLTFTTCRYSCYDDIHVDETIVDALKIVRRYGFKTSEKLVTFFPKNNYDIEKEGFSIYEEIKPTEIIDADIFIVLKCLENYKKDYQKIVTLIINYLLSEL